MSTPVKIVKKNGVPVVIQNPEDIPGGGGGGAETDPIYTSEKNSIALNSNEDAENIYLNNGNGEIITIPKIEATYSDYRNLSETIELAEAVAAVGLPVGEFLSGEDCLSILSFYNCKKLVLRFEDTGPFFANQSKLGNATFSITFEKMKESAGDCIKIEIEKYEGMFAIVKNWVITIIPGTETFDLDIDFFTSWNNIIPKPILLRMGKSGLTQTIAPGAIFNFNSLLSNSDFNIMDENALDGDVGFTFSGTGSAKLLKFPPYNFVNYSVQVTINGSISGAAGTAREFKIQLARTTPTVFTRGTGIVKVDNNILTDRSNPPILTFQQGTNDPFVTDGVRIELNNTTTQTITINSFNILIQGTK